MTKNDLVVECFFAVISLVGAVAIILYMVK